MGKILLTGLSVSILDKWLMAVRGTLIRGFANNVELSCATKSKKYSLMTQVKSKYVNMVVKRKHN